MARTFEYVLHFVRCVTVTVSPNQIISIIIITRPSDLGSVSYHNLKIRSTSIVNSTPVLFSLHWVTLGRTRHVLIFHPHLAESGMPFLIFLFQFLTSESCHFLHYHWRCHFSPLFTLCLCRLVYLYGWFICLIYLVVGHLSSLPCTSCFRFVGYYSLWCQHLRNNGWIDSESSESSYLVHGSCRISRVVAV